MKNNCYIIKDISKDDAYFLLRKMFIGKIFKLMRRNKWEKGEFFSCSGTVIGMEGHIKGYIFSFHKIKLEKINMECKDCKYRLKCITEGI